MPLAFNFLTSLFKYYSLFLYVYATKMRQNNIIYVQNSVKYIFFCYLRPENGFKAQGYAMQTHLFSPLRLLV